MKVLVTGVNGQLGYDVVRELLCRNDFDVVGVDVHDLDITDREAVIRFVLSIHPDAIIHCAAYTAVDKAESDQSTCMKVNVEGTRFLAEAAILVNSKLMYISTDYIFDGFKQGAYETNDAPHPLSVYGLSKYLGEKEVEKVTQHFIVRISWAFGKNGSNFVKTILRLSKELEVLRVVHDQIGSPTYTKDLSVLLADMIISDKFGIYHATNEGSCTWFDFAKLILKYVGKDTEIIPVLSDEISMIAIRPQNSILSKLSLDNSGFRRLPDWKDALHRYLHEIEVI